MSLSLAIVPDLAITSAADSVRNAILSVSGHDRPRIARQIQSALRAGLLKDTEVRKALASEHSARSLAKLGCTLLRRFARSLGGLPTLDATVGLAAGADWLSDPSVRQAMRWWFGQFVERGALSPTQIRKTLPHGDGAMLALLAEGWRNVAQSITDEVARKVGPTCETPLQLYVSPSVLDGEFSLEREHGPVGVSVETPQALLFTLESLDAYANDDRLPLLMAALTQFAARIRCLEVLTPTDVLDGEQMYCEWLEAIAYHAASSVQPDGSIRIPDMLTEQLSEEFGVEVTDDDRYGVSRTSIANLLKHFNDPGVLTVAKIDAKKLPKALRVAAGRGGRLGSVLEVMAKALAYLDSHAMPIDAIRYSAGEESYSPAMVFAGKTTGFEEHALYNRFTAAMESGCSFGHVVDSETQGMDVAIFALRETSCISSVIRSLESLDGEV